MARLATHCRADPAVRNAEPAIDPVTLARMPAERVHVMNAVGLIVLMVLWVLVVRQFGPATLGSLLVMLIWGFRILAR